MSVSAYVLIEAASDKTRGVLKGLTKIPGVKSAHAVTGPFDIIAWVEAADHNSLGDMVLSKIRKVPGIVKTMTCVAVEP